MNAQPVDLPLDADADVTAGPLARVRGQPMLEVPKDLYIPPDALEIMLENFEGPLDLLLYLIKRQNLDILDIPIAEVTRQYMTYIALMTGLRLELAAEYLVMAAMLAEIKSHLLLPKPVEIKEEDDPRAELVRRLQAYERFKLAGERIDQLPRLERDLARASAAAPVEAKPARRWSAVGIEELVAAARDALTRAEFNGHHRISREPLSVRERMTRLLERIEPRVTMAFLALLEPGEGRAGVVVTLLAVLELLKGQMIELVQREPYGPIYLRTVGAGEEDEWEEAALPEDEEIS